MKALQVIKSLVLFVAIFIAYGCELEDRSFNGPIYYEFSPVLTGQTNLRNILFKESTSLGADAITVQMIQSSSEATKVNFRIADQVFYLKSQSKYVAELPEGTPVEGYELYQTSAVYGVDYQVVTGLGVEFDTNYMTGSIVIGADASFGAIPVEIYERSGKSVFLVLEDSHNAMANKPTSIMYWMLPQNKTVIFNEPLTEALPEEWYSIDRDGDGYDWYYSESRQSMASQSYVNEDGVDIALTPENYLVTAPIAIPNGQEQVMLTFELAAAANTAGYHKEKYRIVASEQPITAANIASVTILRDYTELTLDHKSGNFIAEQISLDSFKGKSVYIGFVHGNCTDMDRLLLRNVSVYLFSNN